MARDDFFLRGGGGGKLMEMENWKIGRECDKKKKRIRENFYNTYSFVIFFLKEVP